MLPLAQLRLVQAQPWLPTAHEAAVAPQEAGCSAAADAHEQPADYTAAAGGCCQFLAQGRKGTYSSSSSSCSKKPDNLLICLRATCTQAHDACASLLA